MSLHCCFKKALKLSLVIILAPNIFKKIHNTYIKCSSINGNNHNFVKRPYITQSTIGDNLNVLFCSTRMLILEIIVDIFATYNLNSEKLRKFTMHRPSQNALRKSVMISVFYLNGTFYISFEFFLLPFTFTTTHAVQTFVLEIFNNDLLTTSTF